jgi:hypothetical protein
MDVQCPAGLHWLANFSHTADGADELVAKAYGGGLRGDLWIDNHNIRLRKGAPLPGINKIANVAGGSRRHASSFRDLVRARRRRQSGRHRLVGNYQPGNQQDAAGDQNERYQSFRHGTLLVHYIKKLGEAGHFEVQRWHSALGLPSGVYRKCSISTEDAHTKSMRTFGTDEHLRAGEARLT